MLTPEQARSLGAQRYVAAFGELKVRSKLLTADGQPKDLVLLYNSGDAVVVSLMGQLLTYMNAFKVGMLLLAVEVEVGVCTRVLHEVRAICLMHMDSAFRLYVIDQGHLLVHQAASPAFIDGHLKQYLLLGNTDWARRVLPFAGC